MNIKKVPKLRFPGFNDEWEEKKLGEIFNEVNEKVGNRNIDTYSITAGKGFVSQKEKFGKDISGSQNTNYTLLSTNEFSYNKGNSKTYNYGCVYLNNIGKEIAVPNVFISFSLTDKTMNPKFFEQKFKGHYLDKQLRKIISSGARMDGLLNVSKSDFFIIKVTHPGHREQDEIAGFLNAVDEKIDLLTKRKEQLEKYKKGVMQQIFSQKIRFKDKNGQDFPDWQTKKLDAVFDCKKGQGLSKDDVTKEGAHKCVLYGELYTTYKETIDEVISKTNNPDGTKSKSGDLLIPCSTTTSGIDLANASEIKEDNVHLGGDISILRFKNSGNTKFFAYYLTHFKKYVIASYAQGSTIVHLYFNHFKNMSIDEPLKEEQGIIADFLSSIDEKIEAEERKLASAKEFKKALLQQMFV